MQLDASSHQYNPHLADETANLSPAKQSKHANDFYSAFFNSEGNSAQASFGFPVTAEQAPVLENPQPQTGVSESLSSESDSSSDESGSESDSELSDDTEVEDNTNTPSNTTAQSSNSYCRQVTQPFDLGIIGGTNKDESDSVHEPQRRISQQQAKPTSHRKKLAAALAGNSGLLSHSSRSVQNSEEVPVSQKRWNRDDLETAAKVARIDTPEEMIQLCDLSDKTELTPCEPEENVNKCDQLRTGRENGESLLVKIPLSKVQLEAHQKIKPQVCFFCLSSNTMIPNNCSLGKSYSYS